MDWKLLIERCAQGDTAAFTEFVNKYYALLHYLVARRIAKAGEHEDIIQEVFLKFHRLNLFAKFKGDSEGEFRAYLARICLNTVISTRQRQKNDEDALIYIAQEDLENIGLMDGKGDLLAHLIEQDLSARLNQEIALLPETYRDIINLRLLGHSHQEIAEILHKPKGTIDSYNARALEILREKLKDFASE